MNLYTKDGITYLVRVAIPVDKQLPASGNISYKWMLGGGNILITEVKGGHAEIKKAYDQTELYVADHNRVAPAIPFQSMITDRRQEKDSTKWNDDNENFLLDFISCPLKCQLKASQFGKASQTSNGAIARVGFLT